MTQYITYSKLQSGSVWMWQLLFLDSVTNKWWTVVGWRFGIKIMRKVCLLIIRHLILFHLSRNHFKDGADVLELGCWEGLSCWWLCNIVNSHGALTWIDHWDQRSNGSRMWKVQQNSFWIFNKRGYIKSQNHETIYRARRRYLLLSNPNKSGIWSTWMLHTNQMILYWMQC